MTTELNPIVHPENSSENDISCLFSSALEGYLPWLCQRTACFLKNIFLRTSSQLLLQKQTWQLTDNQPEGRSDLQGQLPF